MSCVGYAGRRPQGCEAIHKPSFRDGALAPDPESRDSGFDALHRPGMTAYGFLRLVRLLASSGGGQAAPRNYVETQLRYLAARCVRVVHESFAQENEGAGN